MQAMCMEIKIDGDLSLFNGKNKQWIKMTVKQYLHMTVRRKILMMRGRLCSLVLENGIIIFIIIKANVSAGYKYVLIY